MLLSWSKGRVLMHKIPPPAVRARLRVFPGPPSGLLRARAASDVWRALSAGVDLAFA